MTAKRFTHKEDDWEILDNEEHLAYAHSDYQADKICDLLNDLYEERNYFERKKCEYWNQFNLAHLDNINLRKENKQLKKELNAFKPIIFEDVNGGSSILYEKVRE